MLQNQITRRTRLSTSLLTGFTSGNKNSKTITYKETPVNFLDMQSGRTMYESPDYLKSVKADDDPYTGEIYFLVCEELKYLKKLSRTENASSKRILSLHKEYYIKHNFDLDTANYCLANEMVYKGFISSLCQIKGEEKDE